MTQVNYIPRPPAPWIHARPYPWWPAQRQTMYITGTLVLRGQGGI